MTFGEKLFQLRKEKGLSQEALAEKINTTRQAISKWETGQGYPETEKLLMIGNIFGVSMDYLLKDSVEPSNDKDAGYYVSKEMAEGYLLSAHKVSKYMALGFFLIALSFIPYFIFKQDPAIYIIPTILFATFGIGMFVSASFLEEDQYKVLKTESLLFDEKYLKGLTVRYEDIKKRYVVINLVGFCLFAAGLLAFGIERKFITSEFLVPYYPVCIGLIAIGIYIVMRTSTLLDAYKLLAKNEVYTNSFGFKFRRKVRKKVDDF
ncbi:transcriptional regulator [Paenibacillus selenitireducens]|jgi:transcriptional regulator with XRE-family HTH domain|uniref:Transcriptional regulator n=1 Tax=Paenibacillus selenitireducens TaxID=1324314 RepID=A0A1T2XHX0_9BACL|nr:helix-turn-helix transcriptional regulator [Paenibacillus selenitireducens]OPA79392.1 transcriptional regulator [Paenibacillus selenitireducens]